MDFPPSYPDILIEIADLIYNRLVKSISAEEAERIAMALAEDIRLNWGGGLIYIPKGNVFERRNRDMKILIEFDGENHAILARKYGMAVASIYEIIARYREK